VGTYEVVVIVNKQGNYITYRCDVREESSLKAIEAVLEAWQTGEFPEEAICHGHIQYIEVYETWADDDIGVISIVESSRKELP